MDVSDGGREFHVRAAVEANERPKDVPTLTGKLSVNLFSNGQRITCPLG